MQQITCTQKVKTQPQFEYNDNTPPTSSLPPLLSIDNTLSTSSSYQLPSTAINPDASMNQNRISSRTLASLEAAWPREHTSQRAAQEQATIDHVLNDILAEGQADRHRLNRRAIITGEMVMDAALPRGKLQPYWMAQCSARLISLGVGLVGLVCGIYLAVTWSSKKGEGGITVAANGMAMIIDGFATANLFMPKIPRVSPFALICLDFVMFVAALTAGCLVGFSDREYIGDRPWAGILIIAASITWTVSVLRLMFLAWSCVDGRKIKKTRRSMRRTLRTI